MARSISKRLRFQILRRDGFRCVYCGSSPGDSELRIDHVIPYAKGGTDDPKNLVTSCFNCNSGKSDTVLPVGGKFIQHGKYRLPQTVREVDEELELVRAQLRKVSLRRFVLDAYPLLQTGTDLKWAPYLDAICDHLQALVMGDLKRLIINVRNRSLKSSIASVCLNPWAWLSKPHLRFFTGGHDKRLAEEHCWSSRLLIRSGWYQRMLDSKERWYLDERAAPDPSWELAPDQDQKSFYANTKGGRRISAQTGAGTGKGGHVFVIDDDLSVDQSYSDTETAKATRWVLQTVMRGFDDPNEARMAVVQHRLRPDDTSGELLRLDLGFEVVSLPLEFDTKRIMPVTSLGWKDPRTEDGESLCPERWDAKQIEQDKIQFGTLYEAICNQNPQKRGEKVIRPEWIRHWSTWPEKMRIVQSWDLSFKGRDPTQAASKRQKRSKTGGVVLGFTASQCYILDRFSDHADWIQQKEAIRQFRLRWPDTTTTYIEDEANGSAMTLELSVGERGMSNGIPGVVPVNPTRKGGKWARLNAVAPYFRAGNVLFPPIDHDTWVKEMIDNIVDFGNRPYDEDPDIMSQALSEEWVPSKLGEETPEQRAELVASIDWVGGGADRPEFPLGFGSFE